MSTILVTAKEFQKMAGRLFPPLTGPLPTQMGNAIAQVLVSGTRKRFNTSLSPDGKRWEPLKGVRPSGGSLPLLDTGQLRASVSGRGLPDGAEVGTNLPYAGVHQFGATIVPRTAKYLCIPQTKEARRAGSPRNMQGLTVRINKAKTAGVMLDRQGRVQFVMTKRVVIPARPFLGVSQEDAVEIAELLTMLFEIQPPSNQVTR